MSADEYTPTRDEVRADYVRHHTRNFDEYQVGRTLTSEQQYYGDQFDRFVSAQRRIGAQALAERLLSDEAIEAGARTAAQLEPGEPWPSNEALGGSMTGTRDDEYHAMNREIAHEIIEAALSVATESPKSGEGER